MKKRIYSLFLIILTGIVLVAFSGCSTVVKEVKKEINEEISEGKSELIAPEKGSNSIDDSEFIGEEKAKEIALEKAGFNFKEVTFTKVQLDIDDGIYIYEIEFRKGKTEYETEISATDGKIISWDVDRD